MFPAPVVTRFIVIRPIEWNLGIGLRLEILGCAGWLVMSKLPIPILLGDSEISRWQAPQFSSNPKCLHFYFCIVCVSLNLKGILIPCLRWTTNRHWLSMMFEKKLTVILVFTKGQTEIFRVLRGFKPWNSPLIFNLKVNLKKIIWLRHLWISL